VADGPGVTALPRPVGRESIETHHCTELCRRCGSPNEGSWTMNDEIRAFIVKTILDMGLGYELAEIQDDTVLGPEGLDMESLTMAELAVRVEDQFGIEFGNDEAEQLALMTIGEFVATVADRVGQGSVPR
jgi:acyl carrier protein